MSLLNHPFLLSEAPSSVSCALLNPPKLLNELMFSRVSFMWIEMLPFGARHGRLGGKSAKCFFFALRLAALKTNASRFECGPKVRTWHIPLQTAVADDFSGAQSCIFSLACLEFLEKLCLKVRITRHTTGVLSCGITTRSGSGLHGLDALGKNPNSLIRPRLSPNPGCHVFFSEPVSHAGFTASRTFSAAKDAGLSGGITQPPTSSLAGSLCVCRDMRPKKNPLKLQHGGFVFSSFSAGKHSGLSPKYESRLTRVAMRSAATIPTGGDDAIKIFARWRGYTIGGDKTPIH